MQRYFVKLISSTLEALSGGKRVIVPTFISKNDNFNGKNSKILFLDSYELIDAKDDINVFLIKELPNNGTMIRISGYWNSGSMKNSKRQMFKIYMGIGINSVGHLVVED